MKLSIEDLETMLAAPESIEEQERIILGLKADRDKLKRKLDAFEAKTRLSDEVKAQKNEKDRDAMQITLLSENGDYQKMVDRMITLRATIASHEAERDFLRRERDSLQTAFNLEFARRFEKCLENERFKAASGVVA